MSFFWACSAFKVRKEFYVTALSFLKRSGYTKVENIGGITGYQGEVVR